MTNQRLDPNRDHDACGIGAVVDILGRQTHQTVSDALSIVERLEHRAGKDASGKTGDGVGILLQIPHGLFSGLDLPLGPAGDYGVGMFFLPTDPLKRGRAQKLLERLAEKEGLPFLGWRTVPTRPEILGERARSCMPTILQAFLRRPANVRPGVDFDRRLYVLRRVFEQSDSESYVVSLSSRTIVYKGMFLVGQLRAFYQDLGNPECASALALVHSRFSTNTNPSWQRAHPNRVLLHNGEINTIRGNVDRMLAREETMFSSAFAGEMEKIFPVVDQRGSDSAMLDNTLEFLMMSGMELPMAAMICVPEPWQSDSAMERQKRDFYRYYATMMEPWDGPAALLFSDGDIVGATLDRNGLRPCRYYVTDDQRLILASEVGVLDIPDAHILKKSRLAPGKMLVVDTKTHKLYEDNEIKERYAHRAPYGEWLDQNLTTLAQVKIPNKRPETDDSEQRERLCRAFGYTYEDLMNAILPMAQNGAEATASMGVDTPLAVLSGEHRLLFDYFKQLFAQVTNPPIDAIREECVTDTAVYLGSDGNLLEERGENCCVLQIKNPILTDVDMLKLRSLHSKTLFSRTVSLLYYTDTPLKRALDNLFVACDKAYHEGANILILSDRGVDENHLAIPSLLAVSALEQYLIRTKKRTAVSVVLESADPRDLHHFAALLGYGARAVYPYLAHECIAALVEAGVLDKDIHTAIDDYNSAILHGVVKIASKMGVSSVQSYQSAQIFEIVGIDKQVVDEYFTNTVSRVEGVGLVDIENDVKYRHDRAFDPLELTVSRQVDSLGLHKSRSQGERHLYDPLTIHLLQQAVRTGDYATFQQYTTRVNDEQRPCTLRGLLDFKFPENGGIPLEEVEPACEIVKRFKTGAMSYGSISQEAHECLAMAMNRLGGLSNSGEGGESPERLGTEKGSAIKQVASGRFGVTSEYLLSAREIQIKMAQGAKPGEGGHLPGGKVYTWIAKTRYATPGVALISPPPHHDIYSIEDLAQLIFDLKNANRKARISVKLVSEAGVGTIASGVAKAGAQVVLISGHDGGTGAAPRSSIHHAGLPWELGVAETHRTLLQNGLRSRVRIETDGKLMSGRDVAIATMLGAEEFGFATAPLVAMGCVMMRVCNLDTCPMGIATQNPELRKNFQGKPEHVMNFMLFIAEELRELLARLGLHTVDELVGRSDLLVQRDHTHGVNLSCLVAPGDNGRFDPAALYDFHLERTTDERLLMPVLEKYQKTGQPQSTEISVSSTDRALGTILGSEITRLYGTSLTEDIITVACQGGGGQSFGAFIPKGLSLCLTGDANDYFGKGLSGGKLTVRPPRDSKFLAEDNVIIGNVAFYGATSGEAYINGRAGERFCVRNSGATVVVEGVGDHGCEYMTGGAALVLGPVGKNFAAGMSGGVAYVLDRKHDLYLRLNKSLVDMETVVESSDIHKIRAMLEAHILATGSPLGRRILADFNSALPLFKKIIPRDYRDILAKLARKEDA